ncbi:hypothetical protein EUGRSUZ_H03980 [Eucalyptus grandis]|uniref:Uncharacterized protein n=2 Tax=Eucalyptus grandis TaxID=71139 RepID=A0ACC3JWL6_EUCGR|nr:hypothetical protein EUGRSUZ_H03980 [Eucalyptus grandis]
MRLHPCVEEEDSQFRSFKPQDGIPMRKLHPNFFKNIKTILFTNFQSTSDVSYILAIGPSLISYIQRELVPFSEQLVQSWDQAFLFEVSSLASFHSRRVILQ